jgi:hypothetical protein
MDTILLAEDKPMHAHLAGAWRAPAPKNKRRWGPLFVLPLLFLVAGSLQAAAASGPTTCADIATYHVAMQMNAHADAILRACGVAPAPARSQQELPGGGVNLGGTDIDLINGGEGTYPQVTQSETQTWAAGNTIVTAYNASPTTSTCYGNASTSIDGGATFTFLNHPFCNGHGTNYGDPVALHDQLHGLWAAVFLASGCGGQGMGVWTSTDGLSWKTGACAHNGSSDDRESGSVDDSASSPFYGRMYLTWNDFTQANANIFVTHSDDGGTTWSAPTLVETNLSFIRNVQVTTGPDGSVFIAGMDEGGGGLGNRTNYVFRSADGGATFISTVLGSSFPGPGISTCGYFAAMFPSYWRSMGWGDIGAGPNGVTSYAFAEHGAGADPGDIYYTRSVDNGTTWSAPIKLNTDGTARAQWAPSLAVSPTGEVAVSWYDARNTTGNDYERFVRISPDDGQTFQPDDDMSDVVSPLPTQPDPAVQPCYAGDYDRNFVDASAAYGAWVDGRVFISGVSQQDVFFDKVALAPPAITLSAVGYKVKGLQKVDLTWSPSNPADHANIIRDGVTLATVADTGAYTDPINAKGNATYVYQVTIVESGEDSNTAVVKFGRK